MPANDFSLFHSEAANNLIVGEREPPARVHDEQPVGDAAEDAAGERLPASQFGIRRLPVGDVGREPNQPQRLLVGGELHSPGVAHPPHRPVRPDHPVVVCVLPPRSLDAVLHPPREGVPVVRVDFRQNILEGVQFVRGGIKA